MDTCSTKRAKRLSIHNISTCDVLWTAWGTTLSLKLLLFKELQSHMCLLRAVNPFSNPIIIYREPWEKSNKPGTGWPAQHSECWSIMNRETWQWTLHTHQWLQYNQDWCIVCKNFVLGALPMCKRVTSRRFYVVLANWQTCSNGT